MVSIREKIVGIIAEKSAWEPEYIKDEHDIMGDLACTTKETAEIIVETGKAFGIEISDEEAVDLLTVGQLVKFVEGRVTP